MANNNDLILIDKIVETEQKERYPDIPKADFFEQFVAEQVLKNFDLSNDDIEYGLVGGANDGGIDGFYTLVNGELAHEDSDHGGIKRQILIDVYIVQSKTKNGFDEDSINKLIATSGQLFDLGKPLDTLTQYNQELLELDGVFRRTYTDLAAKFPEARFHYVFATRGVAPHPNVVKRVADLNKTVLGLFPKAGFDFKFLGATELLELARLKPATTYQLPYIEGLTGKEGFIALVRLHDLFNFICTDQGLLNKTIFEANVRDYQGKTNVNEEVQHTLESGGPEEFWWLNNGITIVATQATQGNKILTVEAPQIVNGQQTSTEIFKYCSSTDTAKDERSVMVRVIVATDEGIRDKIIKATNSQTQIQPASLRATDKIHRDIEDFMVPFGVFYDRRKNSHRQQGRPTSKIISITLLAQSVMSILLQRPDNARARPSTLIKNDADYAQIFSEKYPLKLYLVASKVAKAVHAELLKRGDLQPRDRTNIIFYVAMMYVAILTKSPSPKAEEIANIDFESLDSADINRCIDFALGVYTKLGADDNAAKGAAFVNELKQHLVENIKPVKAA